MPIVHLILKLKRTHPLFAKNTAAVFLLVVKMAASRLSVCKVIDISLKSQISFILGTFPGFIIVFRKDYIKVGPQVIRKLIINF